jgi:hypothetical protein
LSEDIIYLCTRPGTEVLIARNYQGRDSHDDPECNDARALETDVSKVFKRRRGLPGCALHKTIL